LTSLPDPITYPAGDCITANSNQLHDATEWIARFEAESKGENELPPAKPTIANEQASVSADAGIAGTTAALQFESLYDRHINRLSGSNRPSAAYVDVIRSRHLFKAIVQQNRALFENARILELPSGDGRWGLALMPAPLT
jgi:hypothetical protein